MQGAVSRVTSRSLYTEGPGRLPVQPCTILFGKYVCAPTCCSCWPSTWTSGELSCDTAGCSEGFSGQMSCMLHGREGDGTELLEVSLLGTARACQGLLSDGGGHFCATCFLSVMTPAAFPSLPLDKLIKPTLMFLPHTGDAQDPSNHAGGWSKE